MNTLHKFKHTNYLYYKCDPITHDYIKPLQTIQVSKGDLLLKLEPLKHNTEYYSIFLDFKSNSFIIIGNGYTEPV